MKNTTILFIAITTSTLQSSAVNLKDALAGKMISVSVTGSNYDSLPASLRKQDFHPEMEMTVSNLTSQPLSLELDPGYMLEATEHGYQAMLLTQAVAVNLGPNKRQRNYLFAMCTQLHNSGPNSSLHYHVAELARPDLLKMAQFIAARDYQSFTAQEAVWSLSDDRPIPAIGDNSAMGAIFHLKSRTAQWSLWDFTMHPALC